MSSENENEKMDQVAAYRHLNSLVYAAPSSGSLISQRTQKLSYPASLTYTLGSTIQFVVNSGSEAVWGPSSYIKLKLEHTNGASAPTICGSMFNLFNQARLYHRSGELLEQIMFSDVRTNVMLRYATSFNDYQKLKYLIGATDVPGDTSAPLGMTALTAGPKTSYFNLPLSLLFGVFGNHNQYIPSQLLAGARVELVLNSTIANCGLTNVTSISGISPVLSLDCATLFDDAQKQILEESADVAESGIQFNYSTWFASQFTPTGGALNIDVLQSASITEKVFLVGSSGASASAGADKFNFKSLGTGTDYSLQSRQGSHYMPIYAIQNDNESFYYSQLAFNAGYHQYSSEPASSGTSVQYFTLPAVSPAVAVQNNCVYAFSLEKSAAGVALSGDPTNNSLIVNVSCQNASNVGVVDTGFNVATVFLQYIRTANCMVDSCVVDR